MSEEMKRCPQCGEEILAVAIKCKHCSSNICGADVTNHSVNSIPAADYGMFLLAVPVISTMLVWFWVGNMNLFQSPGSTMALLLVGTILATAVLASVEASKNGMKSDRNIGTYSSTAWFFIITLFWIVGYPAYLFKRRHVGLSNRLLSGIFIAFIFMGSWMMMNAAIDEKIAEVKSDLEQW